MAVHFLLIGIHSVDWKSGSKLKLYSFAYSYPYFHQSWNLFVPPPKENFKLFVRYKNGEAESEWHDLFNEVNNRHRKNRLAGHESLLLALSNSLRFYSGSESKSGIKNDRTNVNYKILERIALKYHSKIHSSPIKKVEILICIEKTDSHRTEAYYYPFE